MIQFKRGTTAGWKKLKKPLADGQPGYDRDKHKIKVGDGKNLWDKLPYASISEEEVLDSEKNAKARRKQDPESLSIMTYGEESPDKNTVGKLYLQYYDAEPEADYVIETANYGIWTYQKWNSGIVRCCGTLEFETSLQESLEDTALYCNSTNIASVDYPPFEIKTFNSAGEAAAPNETATIQSTGDIVWLATKNMNTKNSSAEYCIISPYARNNSAKYYINIKVDGYWK